MTGVAKTVGTPWEKKVYPARGDKPLSVEYHFASAYLSALLHPEAAAAVGTRAAPSYDREERLLVEDVVALGNENIYVRGWLVPLRPGDDAFSIRMEVMAPQKAPSNVRVVLYWEGGEHALPLREGQAQFEDITLPRYSRAKNNMPRGVQVRIEMGDDRKKKKR